MVGNCSAVQLERLIKQSERDDWPRDKLLVSPNHIVVFYSSKTDRAS